MGKPPGSQRAEAKADALKIVVVVILAVAATLGLVFLVGAHFHLTTGSQAQATVVRVEPAARGDLIEIVSSPGEIQPLKKMSVSAKVAAPIVELPHKEGDQVYGPGPSTQPSTVSAPTTRPSLLVRLDDKDLQAVKRSAQARLSAQEQQIVVARQRIVAQEAQIRSNQAMLADLKRDLGRKTDLLASKDVSQSDVDTAQAKFDQERESIASAQQNLDADKINLTVMEHEKEAAQGDVDKADQDISYTKIESAIDGIVTSLKAEVGEMVVTGTMNNAGTVIMEVADLSQMLMVAHVDESQIDALKEGQKATVRIQAYRGQTFDGIVQTVGQSRTTDTVDQTKYFEVKILLDLKGRRIRSGLSADADIETQRHPKVIKVPSQAVVGRPVDQLPEEVRKSPDIEKNKTQVTVVYRLIDGKAVVTPVSVGPSDDTHTIIKSGLKPGDPVIVGPYKALESLQHGQAVKNESAAPAGPPGKPTA